MPYIKKESRQRFDETIGDLAHEIISEGSKTGDMNYCLSSTLWKIFEHNPRYQTINDIVGVLECVKLEFYRRKASKLEDQKIALNGDIK